MSAQFWARLNTFEAKQEEQEKEIKSLQERILWLEDSIGKGETTLKLPKKVLSS